MPSQLHETIVELFRNRPPLAPKLLREWVCARLPRYTEVSVDSADLTEMLPTDYRADLVLRLSDGAAVLGIIVEVQLSIDDSKRFTWPAYVANLRSRWRCPVCLLVVCDDMTVAQWAGRPIPLGCTNVFIPGVLGPDCIPDVLDPTEAANCPELAVLAAIVHGRHAEDAKAVEIAAIAVGVSAGLDPGQADLYFDLILMSLKQSARTLLEQTMPQFRYQYQSDFAKRYFGQGREQGRVEGRGEGRVAGYRQGRATLIMRQLNVRFGPLSEQVKERIASSSIEELDAIGERLLTAASVEEALTPKS